MDNASNSSCTRIKAMHEVSFPDESELSEEVDPVWVEGRPSSPSGPFAAVLTGSVAPVDALEAFPHAAFPGVVNSPAEQPESRCTTLDAERPEVSDGPDWTTWALLGLVWVCWCWVMASAVYAVPSEPFPLPLELP